MPKPKQRAKLPADKGIRPIVFGADGDGAADTGDDAFDIRLEAADRALIERMRADLERLHGRPYQPRQIVRWALWHCQMADE